MAHLDNVHSELRQRVEGMMAEAGVFWVSSAYRSVWEQTVLYTKWISAVARWGTAGARARGYATAARPGSSNHNKNPARAVDLACNAKDNQRRADLARKWGLHTPIAGEPWHMELSPFRKAMPSAPRPETLQEASVMIKGKAVALLDTPDGKGYYIISNKGGVFCFGSAEFFGSCGDIKLDAEIVGGTVTKTGRGYKLLGADGGLFAFGDAELFNAGGTDRFNAVGLL